MKTNTSSQYRQIALAGLTLILSGCIHHGANYQPSITEPIISEPSDGPPKEIRDVSQISDAIPQAESLARYGNHSPYEVLGKTYRVLDTASGYQEDGIGSWYGEKFAGRKTSSFEPYDPYAMTAAHKTLPLPTYVRVTNLENNKQVIVKVNDRGPFHGGRIIDLSYAAASKLDYMDKGTARVRVEVIETPILGTAVSEPAFAKPADNLKIYLQVAAYSKLSSAQQLVEKLLPTIDAPVAVNSDGEAPSQIHRVRIGPFEDKASAIKISERIAAQNMGSPLVIHR